MIISISMTIHTDLWSKIPPDKQNIDQYPTYLFKIQRFTQLNFYSLKEALMHDNFFCIVFLYTKNTPSKPAWWIDVSQVYIEK